MKCGINLRHSDISFCRGGARAERPLESNGRWVRPPNLRVLFQKQLFHKAFFTCQQHGLWQPRRFLGRSSSPVSVLWILAPCVSPRPTGPLPLAHLSQRPSLTLFWGSVQSGHRFTFTFHCHHVLESSRVKGICKELLAYKDNSQKKKKKKDISLIYMREFYILYI